jgi:hypothetical protein
MTTLNARNRFMPSRDLSSLAALACLACLLGGAASTRAAYTATLGPDATLGDWAQWNAPHNELVLTLTLHPDAAPEALRLFNAEFSWDATRLDPVGDPQPGLLFAGEPESWFAWYDQDGVRTVSQVLLGSTDGVAPGAPVVLFTQRFHATGLLEGVAAIDLLGVTLRGPLNESVAVAGTDQQLVTVDLSAPQGQLFHVSAQSPLGNEAWTALATVDAATTSGDGSATDYMLGEAGGLPANGDPGWSAWPPPSTFTLSAGDGLKTLHLFLRDAWGNRRALADSITLDTTAPDYQVEGLDARPQHQGAQLGWTLPPVGTDFDRLRLYRQGWSGDGVARYPEYDDEAPMAAWPASEAQALAAGFTLVYEGAAGGFTDTALPRDVQRYVAFCVDHAGNVGVAGSQARDRCTTYILGDVRTPWDGIVFVGDLVRLAAAYGTHEGQSGYDAQLDYGPTDDTSRAGIPLTDNRVDFEDLMIHAMNYGPSGPVLSAPSVRKEEDGGLDALAQLALQEQENGLVLRLEAQDSWLGLHVLLSWGGNGMATLKDVAGDGVLSTSGPGHLLLDRVWLEGEEIQGSLARLDFGATGIPADLRVEELELRDAANRSMTVRATGLEDSLPAAFQLAPAHPNPFNPLTRLAFQMDHAASARLEVYNSLGQRVATLAQGWWEAGRHELAFDASALASGLYIARLESEGRVQQQKLLLVR